MSKIVLYAPYAYTQLTPQEKSEICNGCGAKGGIPVPRTFYGLDISEACNIHDYRYFMGETWDEKRFADDEFLKNLNSIIDSTNSFKFLTALRKMRAYEYVTAVRLWGDKAFQAEKGIKAKKVNT